MKVVIVGGVAGGASAAARIRRLDEHAQTSSGFSNHADKYQGYCRCAGDLLFRGGCVLFGKVLKRSV